MKISRLVLEEEYKRLVQCSLTQQQHEPLPCSNVKSEHVESVQTLFDPPLNETGRSLKPMASRDGEHDRTITLLTSTAHFHCSLPISHHSTKTELKAYSSFLQSPPRLQ